MVDARSGESDARIWRHQFDREAKARALIDQILARNGGRAAWLDLTKLTAQARVQSQSPMSDELSDNG